MSPARSWCGCACVGRRRGGRVGGRRARVRPALVPPAPAARRSHASTPPPTHTHTHTPRAVPSSVGGAACACDGCNTRCMGLAFTPLCPSRRDVVVCCGGTHLAVQTVGRHSCRCPSCVWRPPQSERHVWVRPSWLPRWLAEHQSTAVDGRSLMDLLVLVLRQTLRSRALAVMVMVREQLVE
jgi:hypothetical protein